MFGIVCVCAFLCFVASSTSGPSFLVVVGQFHFDQEPFDLGAILKLLISRDNTPLLQ